MTGTARSHAFRATALAILGLSLPMMTLGAGLPPQEAREIKVVARKYVFIPKTITVRKGERIKLVVTSEDVDHGIAISAFDIDQAIKAKQTKVIEFTPDKEGKFEIICSVFCGDGHPEMTGELIVTGEKSGSSAEGNLDVSFESESGGVAIVESAGVRWRIDTNARTVTRIEGEEPSAHNSLTSPGPFKDDKEDEDAEEENVGSPPPPRSRVQDDTPSASEPYDYAIVNVPTPKRVPRHSLNVHFAHRFQEPFWPLDESANNLFGLDSDSVSAFGFTFGFTDRLYGKAYRSPVCRPGLCRTIELGVGYHWLDEAGRSPVALSTYASVEGDDNFRHDYTWNIQAMIGRSITRYVHAFFSPAVHINSNGNGRFNPRPELTPFPEAAANLRLGTHTGSFGFGFNGRILRTASLLFEYTPRVGFKMGQIRPIIDEATGQLIELVNESEAGFSFGIEKRMRRHVFSLTFSNTQTTTTARYNSSNLVLPPSKVTIGFNIFRRLL